MQYSWPKIKRICRSDSGVILLVALWMMIILSILALGLGKRTSIDLSLTRYFVGKAKASHIAWAGLLYALDLVRKDSMDEAGRNIDTLYACGVTLQDDKIPGEIFGNIPLGDGYFDVSYISPGDDVDKYYGLQDEERRININAITQQNYKALSSLISLLGLDEDIAVVIASSVVDWHDANSNVTNQSLGAEDEYYQGQSKPYLCKDAPFDSIEELLLVRGVTQEIFAKVKDYITVFPQDNPQLLINFNTAPEIVIRAIGRSVAGADATDADSMAAKIVAYRAGDDAKEYTADDKAVDMENLALNAKERAIFLTSRGGQTDKSNYLRITVKGTDKWSEVTSDAEMIVYRDDLTIVSWRHN